MIILILCILTVILVKLIYRLKDVIITDFTKEYKTKLKKFVAMLIVIDISLIVYVVKNYYF